MKRAALMFRKPGELQLLSRSDGPILTIAGLPCPRLEGSKAKCYFLWTWQQDLLCRLLGAKYLSKSSVNTLTKIN